MKTSISPRAVEALQHLETAVGGRSSLIDTLILAQLDDKQQHFMRLMVDPARSQDTLARICHDANIKPADLIELYRKASFAKANAIAIGKAADAIPTVVADIAAKSVDRQVVCFECRGATTDKDGHPCVSCFGKGTMLVESDHERQKTLLDMLGLSRKGTPGTTIINSNAQINQGNVGSLFSSFVKATDRAAYDVEVTPVDAEVAPVETP